MFTLSYFIPNITACYNFTLPVKCVAQGRFSKTHTSYMNIAFDCIMTPYPPSFYELSEYNSLTENDTATPQKSVHCDPVQGGNQSMPVGRQPCLRLRCRCVSLLQICTWKYLLSRILIVWAVAVDNAVATCHFRA